MGAGSVHNRTPTLTQLSLICRKATRHLILWVKRSFAGGEASSHISRYAMSNSLYEVADLKSMWKCSYLSHTPLAVSINSWCHDLHNDHSFQACQPPDPHLYIFLLFSWRWRFMVPGGTRDLSDSFSKVDVRSGIRRLPSISRVG